jgi:CheY-like chemotaxis protein
MENATVSQTAILVVEDNRDIRESLKTLLELLGYTVAVAGDGVEGVERALELRPRVALVDFGLPRLDGCQVGRRLREALGPDVLLVSYTAHGGPELRARVLEAGFDLHLVKPLDWNLFAPWLAEAVEDLQPQAALVEVRPGQPSTPGSAQTP